MRRSRIRVGIIMLAATSAVLTSAPMAEAAPPPNNTNTSEQVKTSGSDTLYFVMNDLGVAYNESQGCDIQANYGAAPEFEPSAQTCKATQPANIVETENYDHDTLINNFPTGSSEGLRQLCRREAASSFNIQIARSSASPTVQAAVCTEANGGEPTSVLRWVAFAVDSLTWVHWGNSGVTDLTVQNLKDIFRNCSLTHWNQAPGNPAGPYPAAAGEPIRVFTAIPGSGSRASWDSFMGGSSDTCIPGVFKDNLETNGERLVREHQAIEVESVNAGQEAAGLGACGASPGCVSAVNEQWSILGAFGCGLSTVPANISTAQVGTVATRPCTDPAFNFRRDLWLVLGRTAGTSTYPVASRAALNFADMRNVYPPTNVYSNGWLCRSLNQHSKPNGSAGPGINNVAAAKNYGLEKQAAILSSGFNLLIDDPNHVPAQTRENKPFCKMQDWTIQAGTAPAVLTTSGP